MSFEKQLKEVFDIDIWELKSQYQPAEISDNMSKVCEASSSEQNTQNEPQLLYSNGKDSSKLINVFVSDATFLIFYKNIANALFLKSKVNIYSYTCNSSIQEYAGINLFQDDFTLNGVAMLSTSNKKYILSKLYPHADF